MKLSLTYDSLWDEKYGFNSNGTDGRFIDYYRNVTMREINGRIFDYHRGDVTEEYNEYLKNKESQTIKLTDPAHSPTRCPICLHLKLGYE